MSSQKVLPCPPLNNHTFFSQSPEIRFRELLSASIHKPPKRSILIQNDPWRALKQSDVERSVEKIEDRPEQPYEAIKRRSGQKNKFILLEEGKENRRLLEAIEAKRVYCQGQFRSLLRDHMAEGIIYCCLSWIPFIICLGMDCTNFKKQKNLQQPCGIGVKITLP